MAAKVAVLSQVVKDLYKLKCCSRCVLRFTGLQNGASLYAKPYQQVVQHVLAEYGCLPEAGEEDIICGTCLGLLQEHAETNFVKQICDAVKATDHEYINFSMAVNSPLALKFRHHSMWIYLQESFSEVYPGEVKFDNILPVKDCLKFIYGPRMEEDLESEFSRKSLFTITLTLSHVEATKDLDFLLDVPKTIKCHPRKRRKILENEPAITLAMVSNCIETLETSEDIKKVGDCPSKPVSSHCEVMTVECMNSPVFVTGRYNKYSRTLSQSPWIVNDQRMTENSVQELISAEIEKVFRPDELRFSSAGREDVDVRMLGRGRPFILELINPRKVTLSADQMKELQNTVNTSTKDIKIRDLQITKREECSHLKEAENSKTKCYSALVYVPEGVTEGEITPLHDVQNLVLAQKTPLRVLHRYIKEFVHGDFGRTKPNLTKILKKETDILELDVESVDVDWPPYIDD